MSWFVVHMKIVFKYTFEKDYSESFPMPLPTASTNQGLKKVCKSL